MKSLDDYVKNLNPSQRQAVEKTEGPLLILAGAGSGKTRVLTHRAAYLVAKGLALPDQFLAVTFTNKAAGEMEQRIYSLLAEIGFIVESPLWISTFHSLCSRLLRKHIELLDYKPFFAIYDSSDQLSMIKKVMAELNISDKMTPAKNYASRINTAKMMGLGPQEVAKSYTVKMDPQSLRVYEAYEAAMKRANALDFGDLLLKTYEMFLMYPDLLQQYQEQFKYIMIDEYQDTNNIQYRLVNMLAKGHKNLCVVGDEDQSIYSWRGADISNILNFERDYPNATVIKLEENYRSTKTIVTAASHLIRNNTERKDKTLFTSNAEGEHIHIREERNEYDEARFVASTIADIVAGGEANWSEIAVFYRTNAQSRVIEEQLRVRSIPYRLVGGVRFYERMEIKDILSYMRLIMNPSDDIAFKRVINTPTRGIGKTTVERLEEIGNLNKTSLLSAASRAVDSREFNAGTTGKIRRFVEIMDLLTRESKNRNLSELYHLILDQTEYAQRLKNDDSPEAQSRLENLEEFDNAISQFVQERGTEASLQTFLEEMALVSDVDDLKEQQNSVTLMTLHVSKGLEFPYVFIVGMEEGLFPNNRAFEDIEESELEEERRLAYVGITRAEKKLFLTHAQTRKVWGVDQSFSPSRFIKELPPELIKKSSGSIGMPSFMRSPHFQSAPKYKEPHFDSENQEFPDYDSDHQSQSSAQFSKGMRVKHPTFGVGSIYQTEGSGDDLKLSILFADNTIKKFVAKYARLERL